MLELSGNSLKSYSEFKNAVGMTESSNKYSRINSIGCMGKYQFCPSTFKRISKLVMGSVISKKSFLSSPQTQEAFFDKLVQLNTASLYKHLPQARKTLGSWVTLSGLIGGAHLGGAGSIAKKSGVLGLIYFGKDRADGNGTKISSYIKKFSGYEIPNFTESNTHLTTDNKTAKNSTKITEPVSFSKDLILPAIAAVITVSAVALFSSKKG